ncbi:MAG: CvpA family protein [Eubacterium sp.]
MTVNYVDIALIAVSALIIFVSSRRGILIALVSMTRVFVGVPLSFYVSSNYCEPLYYNYIQKLVLEKTQQKIADRGTVTAFAEGVKDTVNSLPSFITKEFDFTALEKLNAKSASEYLELNIIRSVAVTAVEILLFLAVFVAFLVVTGLIISIIKHRNRRQDKKEKAPLRKTDKLLGGLFGLVKAAVLVFALCTVAAMAADILPQNNETVSQLIGQINESKIIIAVNEFNPLLK